MEKVLVCMLNSTRGHDVSCDSVQRFLLDELQADLALSVEVGDQYDKSNPFWQRAKYRWTSPPYDDMGIAYDQVQSELCRERGLQPRDWRALLRLPGIWAGKIQSAVPPRPSASSILPYFRWLLLRGLQRDGLIDRYDRFVITRSDFVWRCPHPPLSILDEGSVWVPDGQHWGGLNDRHAVVSRADLVNHLNGIEDILLEPDSLYEEMAAYQRDWNSEGLVAHLLRRRGLLARARTFPYVMYLARGVSDRSATWSSGQFEPAAGHWVKYPEEYRLASAYATVIRSRADWEKGAWRQFDPDAFTPPALPWLRRVSYSAQLGRVRAAQWLRQPDRLRRLATAYRKTARQLLRRESERTDGPPPGVDYSRQRLT